jgi:hypothetical protein
MPGEHQVFTAEQHLSADGAGPTGPAGRRIVEVKGIELSPELASQLVERGAAWMADQLSQAIEHAAGAPGRRCPP